MSIKWQITYNILFLSVICLFFTSETYNIFDLLYNNKGFIQKKAYKGFSSDQISLGDTYYYKKKQYKKALFWYKKATKNKAFNSYNEIINIYLRINNRDKIFNKNNIYKLIKIYQEWAKAGDIKVQKHLITLSCYNLFPKNNYIKTLYKKWKNNPHMMFECILYKNNLEIGRDNEKIINLFDKLALKNNDIGFKFELWSRTLYSEEQKKIYNKAIFEKAVLNEYPPALWFYWLLLSDFDINSSFDYYKKYYELSIFSLEEKERKKKTIEVLEKLSVKKWDSISSWLLVGSDFSYKVNNIKLEKYDFKEAIKWYKKAYTLGEPKAAYKIGMLYKEGDKTLKQNYSKAFEWFYKSAVQNYMPAQIQIGDMYFNSLGVKQDQEEAIKWYKKASEYDSFFCGVCYKTDMMLNKLGFIGFFKNIKQIYEF